MRPKPTPPTVILAVVIMTLAAGCAAPLAGNTPKQMPQIPSAYAVPAPDLANLTYPVVDTGQTSCFDTSRQISCPSSGSAFFGQDAQFSGNQPSYQLSSDGLTVRDSVTGLTWQRSPDTNGDGVLTASDKLTYSQALALPAMLNAKNYGGYSDWRLPTIKELYSIIDFRGTDPNLASSGTSGLTPFIDTDYFTFAYGSAADGDRIIDSQYATSTKDVSPGWNGEKLFGVNFADGRIKGYGISPHGRDGLEKTLYVLCVRGNPAYGRNLFTDNGNGTITDRATGLEWSQSDSGRGMDWQDALLWVQHKNEENYLGHNDWRLPDAKELQSIVDYTRSPDATGTAAIDPLFNCTPILNEAGQTDYPFYWTGTTHQSSDGKGTAAVYIAFGRAMGYMNGAWQDVHGAGAQRSDPKTGNAKEFPQGRGPQGDAIRIDNFVRLVRGGNMTAGESTGAGRVPETPVSAISRMTQVTASTEQALQHPAGTNPPEEAVLSCSGKIRGTACLFVSPRGRITGTCLPVGIEGQMACVPADTVGTRTINP